jgi:RNA polymerase sigma-70 factor (ECF subfamily)
MEKEIQALVDASQKGDRAAFGELYDAYIERIYRFIYYKTHHKETAEDLTGRVFFKVFKNIKRFDAKQGAFTAWIYRITRNTVIDYYRVSRSEKNIDDVWDLSSDEDIERDVHIRISAEKVQAYFRELSSDQRDVIIMRVWQGMSYREIAEIMGRSDDSCRMLYSRGIQKLRKIMPLSTFLYFLSIRLFV